MIRDEDKDDDDEGYESVVGLSVPFKRVLDIDERPVNPDGSRTGSMFMTIEGCTFTHEGCRGSAAATVGAPSVVVEVSSDGVESRYIVDAHDIVQAAIKAHKARCASTSPKEG